MYHYQSINPNDGQVLKVFEPTSASQLEALLSTAHACSQVWKQTNYGAR